MRELILSYVLIASGFFCALDRVDLHSSISNDVICGVNMSFLYWLGITNLFETFYSHYD
jgi:hypothetical protein